MKLGLALGGGGARGAAHIGVLMELERLGIWPDMVSGTSIGGLVGSLVASGFKSDGLVQVFKKMRFGRLYSLPGRKPALIDNDRLEKLLEDSMGRVTYEQLKIPLSVVTTDLITREEHVIDSGDVVSSVLATTAFPVVLPPVPREGRTLIDGGVLNNTPFDVLQKKGADYVMAIDLSNSAPYGTQLVDQPGSNILVRILNRLQGGPLYQAVTTMADILTYQNVEEHLKESPPDLFMQPDVSTIGLFDFHYLEQGIEAGRAEAVKHMTELEQLAEKVKASQKA